MPALTAASRVNRTREADSESVRLRAWRSIFATTSPSQSTRGWKAAWPSSRRCGSSLKCPTFTRSPPQFNDPLRHAERACYEEEFAVAHRLLFASIDSYLDPASGAALATRT